MIQQFIELGQGYGDIYELCELINTNQHRYHHSFIFTSSYDGKTFASLAVALKPAGDSKFMPIYICREGIPYTVEKPSKRVGLFQEAIASIEKQPILLDIKHSSHFTETTLFYQYIIGILRLNHYIPPLH